MNFVKMKFTDNQYRQGPVGSIICDFTGQVLQIREDLSGNIWLVDSHRKLNTPFTDEFVAGMVLNDITDDFN